MEGRGIRAERHALVAETAASEVRELITECDALLAEADALAVFLDAAEPVEPVPEAEEDPDDWTPPKPWDELDFELPRGFGRD